MAKRQRKKVTTVREHPRRVPKSSKNPDGKTIVDRHNRRLRGTFLDRDEINEIFNKYSRNKIPYPTKNKLNYRDSDKYDDHIAVWTDYFNKRFD